MLWLIGKTFLLLRTLPGTEKGDRLPLCVPALALSVGASISLSMYGVWSSFWLDFD
jgi:hypothetical protein